MPTQTVVPAHAEKDFLTIVSHHGAKGIVAALKTELKYAWVVELGCRTLAHMIEAYATMHDLIGPKLEMAKHASILNRLIEYHDGGGVSSEAGLRPCSALPPLSVCLGFERSRQLFLPSVFCLGA